MRNWIAARMRLHGTIVLALLALAGAAFATNAAKSGSLPIPTTLEDFFIGGTQPDMLVDEIQVAGNCVGCHGLFDVGFDIRIAPNWQGSLMAQAGRDPLFYACLAVANQDATDSGDMCIRCHAPKAWLEGRSGPPTDGSLFIDEDRDGVSCHICHRLVDPVFQPGVSPSVDEEILNELMSLGYMPSRPGTGSFVIDPHDRRRGPFDFPAGTEEPPHFPLNPELPNFLESPFHHNSELCATCHDVSNPVYVRQPDGSYAASPLDQAHPTGDQYDMFPVERTYSEWLNSDYPAGVDAGGVFGGNLPTGVVSSCQDCHMPKYDGKACVQPAILYPPRPNTPAHDFAGGNSWIRDAVGDLIVEFWPSDATQGIDGYLENLDAGQQRSIEMLERAATLTADQDAARMRVTITNESGHKLPTGYPEGRRMWLNVQFFDGSNTLIGERGAYNLLSADLNKADTTVYEAELGVDAAAAALTGLTEGVTFHFALNNTYVKDNRIPPRGFTNAAFDTFGGKPVGAVYVDGQYWSDVDYALPVGAASATVNLYYQTSSKEYIEFLRDENHTNEWGNRLYDLWVTHGKSEPVLMVSANAAFSGFSPGDFDGDGDTDLYDNVSYFDCVTGPGAGPFDVDCEVFDFDTDQDIDFADWSTLQRVYSAP